MPPILLPDPAEVLRGPAPGVEPPALHPEHPCFLPLVLLASCSVVLAAVVSAHQAAGVTCPLYRKQQE